MTSEITFQQYSAREDLQLAVWGGKECLRLELLMDYSEPAFADAPDVFGLAAIRWSVLSDKFINDVSVREFKAILAASLYAKILTVDLENRVELFRRVSEALGACFKSGDLSSLTFAPWHQHVQAVEGSFQQVVWPWKIATWNEVEVRRPHARVQVAGTTKSMMMMKTHTATLLMGSVTSYAPDGTWLRYRPEPELSRVLMPAAALMAISNILQEAPDARGLLLSLLSYINQYYVSPDRIPANADQMAVRAAMAVVLRHGEGDIADYRRQDDATRSRDGATPEGTIEATTQATPTVSPINWDAIEKRVAEGGPAAWLPLAATLAVIIGFYDLPYGYYMLLRLFLCGVCLFFLAGAKNLVLEEWHRWTLGGFAVLYNPILPIRIGDKELWEILNVATVILFWVVSARPKR